MGLNLASPCPTDLARIIVSLIDGPAPRLVFFAMGVLVPPGRYPAFPIGVEGATLSIHPIVRPNVLHPLRLGLFVVKTLTALRQSVNQSTPVNHLDISTITTARP